MKNYQAEYSQFLTTQQEIESLIHQLDIRSQYLTRRYKILEAEIKELCDRFAAEWIECYFDAVQLLIERGFVRQQHHQDLLFSSYCDRYPEWDCIEVEISTATVSISKYPLSVKDEILFRSIDIDWHTDTKLAHQTFVEFLTQALECDIKK